MAEWERVGMMNFPLLLLPTPLYADAAWTDMLLHEQGLRAF